MLKTKGFAGIGCDKSVPKCLNLRGSALFSGKTQKEKSRKCLHFKDFRLGGIKWTRTIDLHDVNVAL